MCDGDFGAGYHHGRKGCAHSGDCRVLLYTGINFLLGLINVVNEFLLSFSAGF